MDHDHRLEITIGKWFVGVSPKTDHGYFENCETGTSGELLFIGKRLVDYDGVGELAQSVIYGITLLGYDASYASDEGE